MYQGYIADAKVKATIENHARIKPFISASFVKCSITGTLTLGTTNCGCNDIYKLHRCFVNYFNYKAGFKNPYDKDDVVARDNGAPPRLGQISIGPNQSGNKKWIVLKTKFAADTDYLTDTIYME